MLPDLLGAIVALYGAELPTVRRLARSRGLHRQSPSAQSHRTHGTRRTRLTRNRLVRRSRYRRTGRVVSGYSWCLSSSLARFQGALKVSVAAWRQVRRNLGACSLQRQPVGLSSLADAIAVLAELAGSTRDREYVAARAAGNALCEIEVAHDLPQYATAIAKSPTSFLASVSFIGVVRPWLWVQSLLNFPNDSDDVVDLARGRLNANEQLLSDLAIQTNTTNVCRDLLHVVCDGNTGRDFKKEMLANWQVCQSVRTTSGSWPSLASATRRTPSTLLRDFSVHGGGTSLVEGAKPFEFSRLMWTIQQTVD